MHKIRFGLVGVTLLLAGAAFYFLGTYEDAPVDPAWAVAGSPSIAEGAVSVRYTGTVRAAGFLAKGSDKTLAFLKAKEAGDPDLHFMTLPRFDSVELYPPQP